MNVHTPDWVKHAVFYQIFPDRFRRSAQADAIPGVTFKAWGTDPAEQGFQGGDLWGIIEKLDYLQELGINALYLNPIFSSASNHRYHTFDFMQVDPLLGGNAALRALLDSAHARGIKVVLDGVFNHASRGFWAFHHILETGGNSPYLDWFHVENWPLRPYSNDEENPANYGAWWGNAALPKFNTDNPGVRQYLFDVTRFWIEFGIDGWRLDVPEEINDVPFWQEFRRIVKHANPEAYIVGEIWTEATEWLQGDRFDAVMNYIFSRLALGFFGRESLKTDYRPGGFPLVPMDAQEFAQHVAHMVDLHQWEVTQAQLTMLDSHDTARTLWTTAGDESALRLSALFQMTMPGAPCIYYGSEIGLDGDHDPGCREAFPWQKEETWNMGLLNFYHRAIALRHKYPALRTGRFLSLYAMNGVYAFARILDKQEVVVIFNTDHTPATFDLTLTGNTSAQGTFKAVWNTGSYPLTKGTLHGITVPARDGLVLVYEGKG